MAFRGVGEYDEIFTVLHGLWYLSFALGDVLLLEFLRRLRCNARQAGHITLRGTSEILSEPRCFWRECCWDDGSGAAAT